MIFRRTYRNMNEQIVPEEVLIRRTLSTAYWESAHKPMRLRGALLIATVLALCLALALPVLAATDAGYALLYSISPETAQFFKPINMSDENQGILMTVESIYIHEDTAEIYISLQDLTGDRLDETTDLRSNYDLDIPNGCESSEVFLRYDSETCTNHYLLTIRETNGNMLQENTKIHFRLGEFVIGTYTVETFDCGIDLTEADLSPDTMTVELDGWGGRIPATETEKQLASDFTIERKNYEVLTPSESLYTITPNIDITAIGYVDDLLHIQVCYSGVLANENHGILALRTEDNDDIEANNYISDILNATFYNEDGTKYYEEYFFDVSPEKLENYTLAANYTPYTGKITGTWDVTFPLKETN